jgi:hypothetical protein
MLAEMGEHKLTIRDYLRHSNLHVTNKYLQATSKTSDGHKRNWSRPSCRRRDSDQNQLSSNDRQWAGKTGTYAFRLLYPNIP